MRYELIITWSQVDGYFLAEVPELPGCMADGVTYEEAIANAQVIIGEGVETARALGLPIPELRGRLAHAWRPTRWPRPRRNGNVKRPAVLLSLVLLLVALVGGTGAAVGMTAAEEDGLNTFAIAVDRPSAAREAAQHAVEAALVDLQRTTDGLPAHFVTPGGAYILHGDLFHTGERYALLNLTGLPDPGGRGIAPGVVFTRWDGRVWELRGLWNISPVWRPAGWEDSQADHLHVRPAEAPFFLEDLSGDGVPEVTVAGEVDKYYQEHYLLRFDPVTRSLNLVADAMARPVAVGGYVRLYAKSGRQAIWEEWRFMLWENGRLVERASWHEEVPYNNPEDGFIIATRSDLPGRPPVRYRLHSEEGDGNNDDAYRITRHGRLFARVKFVWTTTPEEYPGTSSDWEDRYFFSRLTGLPPALYPVTHDGDAPAPPPATQRVTVTGRPAAVRMLGDLP